MLLCSLRNTTPQESRLRWPTQFPFLFGLLTLQASALPQKNAVGPGHPRFCELRLPAPLTHHAALCSWKLSPSAGCPAICPLTGTFSDPGHPRLLSLRPHWPVLSLCPMPLSSVPMCVTLLGLCTTCPSVTAGGKLPHLGPQGSIFSATGAQAPGFVPDSSTAVSPHLAREEALSALSAHVPDAAVALSLRSSWPGPTCPV